MAKNTSVPLVCRKLYLAEPLSDLYEERAIKHGRSVEDEMVMRLRVCKDHTDSQAIYLTDAQRNELSQLAGRLINTPADLLDWARQIVSLKVAGVEIPLGQQLLTRLENPRFGKTWADFMRALVPEKLEEHVGLR
jgi:hypothetical protein